MEIYMTKSKIKSKGTSGYLKPKEETISELNEISESAPVPKPTPKPAPVVPPKPKAWWEK